MRSFRTVAGLVLAAALAGCSAGPQDSTRLAAGGQPLPTGQAAVAVAPPQLGTTDFQPDEVTPGSPTGTFVGQKVVQLRNDLQLLQGTIARHNARLQQIRAATERNAQLYHNMIAAISARLQVGTTPGNPVLQQRWRETQAQLNRLDADIADMTSLANRVTTDAALATYLLDAVRAAYQVSGAVEEDHRQLGILEDEVRRAVQLTDRLVAEISQDVARQSTYINSERGHLQTLAAAIQAGELYAAAAVAPAARRSAYAAAPAHAAAPASRPLVIIRFDRPDVDYEMPLYTAITQALERQPDASFEVVAVAPGGAPAGARRQAERVVRSLTDMGLPPGRVRTSSRASPDAVTNEVHIYVR